MGRSESRIGNSHALYDETGKAKSRCSASQIEMIRMKWQ